LSPDLWILIAAAMLALLLTLPVGAARSQVPGGLEWGLGNRHEPLLNQVAWGERANRAHLNLIENLPSYAIVVLVAHVIGATNQITMIGGIIFLVGRLLHAVIYIAGIPKLRTAVFVASQVGILIYLWQIVAHG
jgi:uncharacterized MAPEG superfamily protein